MIYILHGEDILNSDRRIILLLKKYSDYERVRFNEKNSFEDLMLANLTRTILNLPKIIICEDFLKTKKITVHQINSMINTTDAIIFWEKTKHSLQKLKKLDQRIFIEQFRLPANLFDLLDSISEEKTKALKNLQSQDNRNQPVIQWQLTNRVYLILLAKLQLPRVFVEAILGKVIAEWQWSKIKNQAQKFTKNDLIKIFNGLLKIDYFVKSGRTNLEYKQLISLLFLKYLT